VDRSFCPDRLMRRAAYHPSEFVVIRGKQYLGTLFRQLRDRVSDPSAVVWVEKLLQIVQHKKRKGPLSITQVLPKGQQECKQRCPQVRGVADMLRGCSGASSLGVYKQTAIVGNIGSRDTWCIRVRRSVKLIPPLTRISRERLHERTDLVIHELLDLKELSDGLCGAPVPFHSALQAASSSEQIVHFPSPR
jgi:hypothetical protein